MKLPRKLIKHWHGIGRRRDNKAYQEQWLLGFLPLGPNENSGRALEDVNINDLCLFEPPPGIFYADPFLAFEGGRFFCFYEASPIAPVFGHIECVELDAKGQAISEPQVAIRCQYHLSYPQVFQYDGRWYMLPETSANKTIELWIADEFPHKWSLHATLMENISAADATLHQADGLWWITAAVKQDCRKFGDKLFAWHAHSPLSSSWTPHSQNPIRAGMLYDRPAGELFQHQGRLIRPTQDSVKRYGGAIEFREVTQLTPIAYSEHCIGRLELPTNSGFVGVHTVNSCKGMLAIDLLRLVPREPNESQ